MIGFRFIGCLGYSRFPGSEFVVQAPQSRSATCSPASVPASQASEAGSATKLDRTIFYDFIIFCILNVKLI